MKGLIYMFLYILRGSIFVYQYVVVFRVYLGWFPNVNVHYWPLSILSIITDPYLRFFRALFEPLFGFDTGAAMAITALDWTVDLLQYMLVVYQ